MWFPVRTVRVRLKTWREGGMEDMGETAREERPVSRPGLARLREAERAAARFDLMEFHRPP